MTDRVDRSGLQVDAGLAKFVEEQVLPPIAQDAAAFWAGFAALVAEFAPRNRALLDKRDSLQAQIDAWHGERAGRPIEQGEYQAFLREIGYLV
ncbi:MAG: malate synthase G, partial [Novosphingobium sp.]